jgi:putative spermidine/putrescine transport system ATP-binding protein
MADLVLDRITRRFGEHTAVDDLSFSVERGEFVSILGPSGCGKTTTLRMIAGFEPPDAGRILIDGRDVTTIPPQKRDIGLVFQNYALFPHMTASQNVAFGLEMRGIDRAESARIVASTLELVRLGQLGGRYPNQLSGGQQQRVALARALAIRPRLLLLDEPLSNLDAKLRDEMRDEIRRIQRDVGITAIFVTHDQAEAFALADRVAVMDLGRLQQIADPVSIYEAPANATVSSFIGHANVFKGTIAAVDGQIIRLALPEGIELLCTGSSSKGETCRAFVKHERVSLASQPSKQSNNCLPGRVISRTYLGGATSYSILSGSLTLKSVVPNLPGYEGFDTGKDVFAVWNAADCRAFGEA